ncbi:MAG: hypothetical protein AAGF11_00285 [Myxococcota bacterium]
MLVAILVALQGTSSTTPELDWDAPRSCPDSAFVRDRLERLLANPSRPDAPSGSHEREVRIDARVTQRADDEYRLRLTVHEPGTAHTREASARDCTTLADATALITATFIEPLQIPAHLDPGTAPVPAVDRPGSQGITNRSIPPPSVRSSPPAPEDEPSGNTPASTEPPPLPTTDRPTFDPPPRLDHAQLRVTMVAGRGIQPDLDIGPSVTGAWSRNTLRLEVALTAILPRTRAHSSLAGVALRQSLYALTLRACGAPRGPRWALAMCAGTELGAVVATGQGVSEPRTTASPWGAVVMSMMAGWRFAPRWTLWAGPEGLVGYAISAFTVGDSEPQPVGRGGIRAHLGVEFRLR